MLYLHPIAAQGGDNNRGMTMAKAHQIAINESALTGRTVDTSDTSTCDDLAVECSSDCDVSEQQIGLTADGEPILGVVYWGETESGTHWQVRVTL